MHYVTDLHLHSKYSRAVSPQMTLQTMNELALVKGIDILSASDFTHPLWFKEISTLLFEKYEGMYILKSQISNDKFQISNKKREVLFMLSTEISCIYKQGGKLRRIHNLVFAPSLEIVERINKKLVKRGCNVTADGRPIIGLSAKALLEMILEIDARCMLIPAHVWTPHFGIYGSASGFDSLEECFEDLSEYIYGIETGISSDPEMNWQMEELRNRSILSFSDAHSAPKMAREATVMELSEPTYEQVRQAIMAQGFKRDKGATRDKSKKTSGSFIPFVSSGTSRIVYTIEFYPEEGKYHYSGHRNCNVVFGPDDIRERGNVCPVCQRMLTEGVEYRLLQLSNQKDLRGKTAFDEQGIAWITDKTNNHPPFVKLVPLLEIVAESIGTSVNSKKALEMYHHLCKTFGNELEVILHTKLEKISREGNERIAEGVHKVRKGDISISPGYDGAYGKVLIWNVEEKDVPQLSLDL